MQKNTLKVNVLTPVWTGNADMMPNGLKMSGIIGSMRYIFESLIRREGGHTCDITGDPKKRCNYEKDKNICPACAVFGCTGWARTFKINWNLDPFNKIGSKARIAQLFGGRDAYLAAFRELEKELYKVAG